MKVFALRKIKNFFLSTYALYSYAPECAVFLEYGDAFPLYFVEFIGRFASEEACMVHLKTIKFKHIKKSSDNKNKVHK